jgi:hypothetical protein
VILLALGRLAPLSNRVPRTALRQVQIREETTALGMLWNDGESLRYYLYAILLL